MSNVSQHNQKILMVFKNNYNSTNWSKKTLFPNNIHEVLTRLDPNNLTTEEARILCQTVSRSYFQRWFACIQNFLKTPLMNAFCKLDIEGLLAQDELGIDNFSAIAGSQNPLLVAAALISVKKAEFLTQYQSDAYRSLIIKHNNRESFLLNFDAFIKLGLVSDDNWGRDNFSALSTHQDPESVVDALNLLNSSELLARDDIGSANRKSVVANQSPKSVALALLELHSFGLLPDWSSEQNRNAVASHANPEAVAEGLITLRHAGLLTSDKMGESIHKAVVSHRRPNLMAMVLVKLNSTSPFKKEGADTSSAVHLMKHQEPGCANKTLTLLHTVFKDPVEQSNLTNIIFHKKLDLAASALNIVNSAGFLNPNRFHQIVNHQELYELLEALIILKENNLLTNDLEYQPNFDVVIVHKTPCALAEGLTVLNTVGLLGRDLQGERNRYLLASQANIPLTLQALSILKDSGLLAQADPQANFDTVLLSRDSISTASSLAILQRAGLLSENAETNRKALLDHPYPLNVLQVLGLFLNTGLLTGANGQINFNALVEHPSLFCSETVRENWSRIPSHLLTQTQFNRMIEIVSQNHPPLIVETQLTNFMFQLIHQGHANRAGRVQAFNDHQNTHKESVHKSVSASATRLFRRYGAQISGRGLDKTITDISTWINNTTHSLINDAAKKGFARLISPYFTHTDRSSGISIKQLLALSWIAINDDTNRVGRLEDAKLRFTEALYEIQRGYNLSDKGVDNMSPSDVSICEGGSFNKLIEKLKGTHPDSDVIFMTKETASYKLQIVVKEVAKSYLCSLKDNLNEKLLLALVREGVSAIWDQILPEITEKMFDEFGSLYGDSKNNSDFIDFIKAGKDIDLGDLNEFIEKAKKATGSSGSSHGNHLFFPSTSSVLPAEAPRDEECKSEDSLTKVI